MTERWLLQIGCFDRGDVGQSSNSGEALSWVEFDRRWYEFSQLRWSDNVLRYGTVILKCMPTAAFSSSPSNPGWIHWTWILFFGAGWGWGGEAGVAADLNEGSNVEESAHWGSVWMYTSFRLLCAPILGAAGAGQVISIIKGKGSHTYVNGDCWNWWWGFESHGGRHTALPPVRLLIFSHFYSHFSSQYQAFIAVSFLDVVLPRPLFWKWREQGTAGMGGLHPPGQMGSRLSVRPFIMYLWLDAHLHRWAHIQSYNCTFLFFFKWQGPLPNVNT